MKRNFPKLIKCTAAISLIAALFSCSSAKTRQNSVMTLPDGRIIYDVDEISDAALAVNYAFQMSDYKSGPEDKKNALLLAKRASHLDGGSRESLILIGRISYLLADMENTEEEVKQFTVQGKEAIKKILGWEKDPEASYYMAVNMGLEIIAGGLLALTDVPAMMKFLEKSIENPGIEMGGPYRVTGMLYLKAPPWPTGFGDLEKSLELLEKAVKEYGAHPLNRIFYSEALIEDGQGKEAARQIKKARKLLDPEVWGRFYTERWEADIIKLQNRISG